MHATVVLKQQNAASKFDLNDKVRIKHSLTWIAIKIAVCVCGTVAWDVSGIHSGTDRYVGHAAIPKD